MKKAFLSLSRTERALWLGSAAVVTGSFAVMGGGDVLTLIASLIGVTALVFVAKGMVIGQVLTVAFSVFYGVISFYFRYYGEMITYLGMTAPIAVMAVVEWVRHPYGDGTRVEVARLTGAQRAEMVVLSALATALFGAILRALGNANLALSTVSVTTSFLAAYLTMRRSAYYALAYAANDVVLILLWTLAAAQDAGYAPMVVCFAMFLCNDLYGFANWRRMRSAQGGGLSGADGV